MTALGTNPRLPRSLRMGERSATATQATLLEGEGVGTDRSSVGPTGIIYSANIRRGSKHLYARQYPDRAQAHSLATTAVSNGTLTKPSACQQCGHVRRLDAHHDDYTQPLTVRWLCRACHTHVHPKTQKNVGPVWQWSMTATHDDMASAMQAARS